MNPSLVDVRHDLGRLAQHEQERDEDQDARQIVLAQLPAKRAPVPAGVLAVTGDRRPRPRRH